MKILDNNVVVYDHKNTWIEFCKKLTKLYNETDSTDLKNEIMMLTEAYDATLAYIKWHWSSMYNCDAPDSDKAGVANGIFDAAVYDLIRSSFYKDFIVDATNVENIVMLMMIRKEIYDMIRSRVGRPRMPSVLSFAEFGAFTNINLDPDTPVEL